MKKALVMFAILLTAGIAMAVDYQYLWWMVDASSQPEYAFEYATVSVGGTVLPLSDTDPDEIAIYSDETTGLNTESVYANVGLDDAYKGMTFLFELFDDNDKRIALKSVSGSSLGDYIYQKQTHEISTPFTVSGFTIPEPTSGVLLLLGFAGLALKRKRV